MIEQEIEQVLLNVLHWAYANTLGLIDPFWGYLLEGALIILLAGLTGWAFANLRPFAGAIMMAVVAYLVGFWKGEGVKRKR